MTSLVLLTNGSGTSPEAVWPGGGGVFMVSGTIKRGTVRLQVQLPDAATWVDVGDRTNLGGPGAGRFDLPAGVKVRAFCEIGAVNGTTPSSVTAVVGTLTAADAAGPDRELAVVTYLAKSASTGVAVGDTVTLTQVVDLSGNTPTTVAVIWRNQTTAQDLAGAPPAASLTISGQGALTNAEARATPLGVTAAGLGEPDAAVATTDTGTWALVSLFKRYLSVHIGAKPTASTALGAGASGQIGWLATIRDTLVSLFPASLGPKTGLLSLSVVPASDANVAREVYTSVTIVKQSTLAAGATFNPFSALPCTSLDVYNGTTVEIEYQRGGAGESMSIPPGASRNVQGITNANQVGIRRVDQTGTVVTVKAEAYAV